MFLLVRKNGLCRYLSINHFVQGTSNVKILSSGIHEEFNDIQDSQNFLWSFYDIGIFGYGLSIVYQFLRLEHRTMAHTPICFRCYFGDLWSLQVLPSGERHRLLSVKRYGGTL